MNSTKRSRKIYNKKINMSSISDRLRDIKIFPRLCGALACCSSCSHGDMEDLLRNYLHDMYYGEPDFDYKTSDDIPLKEIEKYFDAYVFIHDQTKESIFDDIDKNKEIIDFYMGWSIINKKYTPDDIIKRVKNKFNNSDKIQVSCSGIHEGLHFKIKMH